MDKIMPNVLVIINRHAFTYSIVKDAGFYSLPPYKGKNNLFLRILREIHFRLNLPQKSIWYVKPNRFYEYFLIYSDLITPNYIDWLHNQYPNSKVIMTFENICTKKNNPVNFYQDFIHFCSGDQDDCRRYNMKLLSPSGCYMRNWKVEKKDPKYDIFFIGKDKRGRKRLKDLEILEKTFRDLGLTIYSHIVPYTRFDVYKSKRYQKYVPYAEVLNKLAYTKAILYLGFGSQKCVTIRIQESLIHKIKLVTDCEWIKEYDFYHPNNFFIIGVDKIEDLPAFLDIPYVEVKTAFFESAYYEDSIKQLISGI